MKQSCNTTETPGQQQTNLGDDSRIRRVLVAEFQLKVDEGQLVCAHLKLVVRPQHPRHPEHGNLNNEHSNLNND